MNKASTTRKTACHQSGDRLFGDIFLLIAGVKLPRLHIRVLTEGISVIVFDGHTE